MNLKTILKWRVNDLLALRALPEDSPEYRRRFKALSADCTQACAGEIMSAKPGSALYPLSRARKAWATAGYAFIVLFLAVVAAFVLSYWLISDGRAPWLNKSVLFLLLGAACVSIAAMLLAANRVTALQNRHLRGELQAALAEYDALPPAEAEQISRTLRQGHSRARAKDSLHCGCCACGRLFEAGAVSQDEGDDAWCPHCGAQYQLVFDAPEAPLDEAAFSRLRSFLND